MTNCDILFKMDCRNKFKKSVILKGIIISMSSGRI